VPRPKTFDAAILVKMEKARLSTLHTLAALEGVDMSTWVRARIDDAARALAARDDARPRRRRSVPKAQPAT